MTIYELKALNEKNGGLFFERAKMKTNGETLKTFKISKSADPKHLIVESKLSGARWLFDVKTGRCLPS